MYWKMLRSAKKILVINLRYIGDTLWMYPFIKNLKLNFPDSEISALVNEGGEVFLELMPELSEVIVFKRDEMRSKTGIFKFIRFLKGIHNKNFETVFILSNSDRPTIIGFASGAKARIGFKSDKWWRGLLLTERFIWDNDKNPHMIGYYLQLLTDSGLKIFDRSLTIDVPESAIKGITERFPILKEKGKKSVIVHPGARTALRQWGAANFSEVINALSDLYGIFLIGGPRDVKMVQDIQGRLKRTPDMVSTDLNLLEFAALCKLSDLFVGNDSAPIHIAAATGLFVIGIYGPTVPKFCGPWTDKKILLDLSDLPCRPCRGDNCIQRETQACLDIIKPEMVIEKVRKAFETDKATT